MKDPRCMVGLHDDAQAPADASADPSVIHLVCSRCGRRTKVKLPPSSKYTRPLDADLWRDGYVP
ncbi:MAG: hypothetical protein MUF35_11320 [Candidatus Nanopelagicales bacterium]|jgi:hypothetical protein|nr:hypothetical protein [Candidatus Nanopelagicales bacterium]